MNTWTVRSKGKIEKLVIFYVLVILAFAGSLFLIRWRHSSNDISEYDSHDVGFLLIISSIFLIPFLIVTFKKLVTAKIPRTIHFDTGNNLTIIYSRKSEVVIPFDALAYSYSDISEDHVSLSFYKTFIGSRGQTVYNKEVQMIGLKWSFSWKIQDVREIREHLESLAVPNKSDSEEKMSLMDKIISA